MKQVKWAVISCGLLILQAENASAQRDSLKALENELNDAKQQHDAVTTQSLNQFFRQVDAGMNGADDAVRLYERAMAPPTNDASAAHDPASESMSDLLGHVGIVPAPVSKIHDYETESEKQARLTLDQANLNKLAVALQLHCGLLHFGALFVAKPDQPGLKKDFGSWLQTAAQLYPQLALPPLPSVKSSSAPAKTGGSRSGGNDSREAKPVLASYDPVAIKTLKLRDSKIANFLGFNLWGDAKQGEWTVGQLPNLYLENVLTPLRSTPTSATLTAWDLYIAMVNADEVDTDKWNESVFPPLQFDRACDEFTLQPDTEKLENIVNIIKAYPTFPKADEWIAKAHNLVAGYRASHGGNPAVVPTPPTTTPAGDPKISITTVQQGDAQIITTHTNAPPVSPAQPPKP